MSMKMMKTIEFYLFGKLIKETGKERGQYKY